MNTQLILDTIKQLKTVTFDGNLISKSARDWLVDNGVAERVDGYNRLTEKGVRIAKMLLLLGDE